MSVGHTVATGVPTWPRHPTRWAVPSDLVPDNLRLSPGDAAPEFTLPHADAKPVALSHYRGQSLLVNFYPAASTPGCTKQA